MSETPDFEILLDKLTSGQLDPEGCRLLNEMLDKPGFTELVEKRIDNDLETGKYTPEEHHRIHEMVMERIMKGTFAKIGRQVPVSEPVVTRVHRIHFLRRSWVRYAAAAVILFAVAGTYFLLQPKKQELLSQAERFKNDVAPGKTGAVLSIEGGKTILLDTAANGQVLGHFTKGDKALTVAGTEVQYALLSTPIARTEVLNLSDGSTVWLNAESSIRFPTVFAGSERVVEVTGEVYFKVAHNANMPFKVKVAGQVIEDIGTEFNINAYGNERVLKTTLVEGAVKVVANGNILLLGPGQQSESDQTGILKRVAIFDMDETLAWKDGLFTYNGASMEAIMRQVARWYGVEVVYGDKVAGEFVADIPREVPVSKLLNVLEGTGKVHFTIEGKKITVFK